MEKNNTGLKVLVIILFLLVLGLGGFIVYDKILSNDKENIDNSTENNELNEEENVVSYNLGDTVVLESLSNITYASIGFPEENGDFSQWKVLREEGEYVILYYNGDELLYGKADKDDTISKYNERKVLFTSNGIDFGIHGEIRILNESDLIQFGCNFETLSCSNSPDWANGWTSFTKDNYKYTLSNGKLEPIEEKTEVLALTKPIIKILKTNIK